VSYTPGQLYELRKYLLPRTGLSSVSLGIVGDAAHQRRASYHNGWDAVLRYGRTAATDYSIRTARDRALPRTFAAMALDIGNFSRLRSLSVHLVAQARRNAPGTSDMREIIYSPDGRTVWRWDRQRGYSSAPRTGEADSSHLWHTHISWYRDSEKRPKIAPFKAFFEPNDVPVYSARIGDRTMTYNALNVEVGEISGLTVITGRRISIGGKWRFKILSGKYAGRYLPATGTVTYTRLPS
jgi:hypothetical protein